MATNESHLNEPADLAPSLALGSALTLGRPIKKLQVPHCGQDTTFAAERFDFHNLSGAVYQHCTFANISFKEATLQNSRFIDCVFFDCYFRRTTLTDCAFVGCRFVDCQFPHVSIRSCDFRYAIFRDCYTPFSEMQYSLPSEPNIREELSRNLAVEAARRGASQEARRYRIAEIRAREANLGAAFRGASAWYQEHYDVMGRVRALATLILSLLNRWLWGYGESAWILIRNLLLACFLVFPLIFYALRGQLHDQLGSPTSFGDAVLFSMQNITPTGISSAVLAVGTWSRLAASFEATVGVVYIALLAAYLFRWSLNR